MTINLEDWLFAEVGTGTDTQTGVPAGPPTGQPTMGNLPSPDPNVANPPPQQMATPPKDVPDVANDPQVPDMPKEDKEEDFQTWRKKYLVTSVKGDVADLKDELLKVRDRDLDPYDRKFVEDNLQIVFLRENSNINEASKEIRKLIKEELDHNNPATTLVHHMTTVLQKQPMLSGCFIKLTGLMGMKADVHRKFIASLLGAVQVGSGALNEDLIYNEQDYSIRISTRLNSRFGEVSLGDWALKQDDPERYLKPAELKRLQDGSPEERDVLRRRVVMESIAETYRRRAFIINVVGTDGTVYTIGWDIASSLQTAYTEGRLVVRTRQDDAAEAMITAEGDIVPFVDLKIMYVQKTGDVDEDGQPANREVEFIARRNGQLFLTAQLRTLREASGAFNGMAFKETPYQGNPSDLRVLARCVPSVSECLLRNC